MWSSPSQILTTRVERDADDEVLHLSGQIDRSSVGSLSALVEQRWHDRHRPLRLDAAAVDFADASLCRLLAQLTAAAQGASVVVENASPAVALVIGACRMERVLAAA